MDGKTQERLLTEIEERCANPEFHGEETVLVVDDEAYVLDLVKQILSACGYKVLSAEGPAEALEVLAKYADEVKLLVTDITMPGLDGVELAKKLLPICPDLKVLFISGFSDGPPERTDLGRNSAFLAKPFSTGTLVQKVRALLDSES